MVYSFFPGYKTAKKPSDMSKTKPVMQNTETLVRPLKGSFSCGNFIYRYSTPNGVVHL